jgi:hypothetical protein
MKKITLYILGTVLILSAVSGCRKDVYGCMDPTAYNYNSAANISNGTCVYYGNVTFWFASNMASATVTINGQTGTITQYYPGGAPSCNAAGCANFSLPVGTYYYTAQSSQYTWGVSTPVTATVTVNGCATYQLQ